MKLFQNPKNSDVELICKNMRLNYLVIYMMYYKLSRYVL